MPAKTKSPAKKGAKSKSVKPAKAADKKISEKASSAKTKTPAAKSKIAVPVKKAKAIGKTKQPVKKAATKKPAATKPNKKAATGTGTQKSKPQVKKNTTPRISTPVLTHGADQHFIPLHVKNAPAPIHDTHKEEQIFHNREEVALHQENQKIKASMATRMGAPKNLRIIGRR